MSEGIAGFIDAAWNDHAADPRGVAARLAAARPLLEAQTAQVGEFLWLAEHVLLGHLGDADAMQPWLDVTAPLVALHPDAAPAFERARLATRLLNGALPVVGEEPPAVQVRALGSAVNGSIARGDSVRALHLLDHAAAIGRAPGAGAEALKALAAAYNNLASHMLDAPRDGERDALMMQAAQGSRDTWREAGTWLNVERAEYLLALCAAAIGDGENAVGHARECLTICEANDADAFERFFAREALGRSLIAAGDHAAARRELVAMQALLGSIDEDSRGYAQSALDKLERGFAV